MKGADCMKAKTNMIIKDGNQYYRLKTGEEVPEMPAKLVKSIIKRGYVEKESEVMNNASDTN
jgi:hypothetical protein